MTTERRRKKKEERRKKEEERKKCKTRHRKMQPTLMSKDATNINVEKRNRC